MTPIVLVVTGHVTRDAVPGLCAELEALLHGPDGAAHAPETGVDCDVGGVVRADLALVEAIARLVLVARRAGGRRLRLRNASPELRSLLDLVGLAEVMGVASVTGAADAMDAMGVRDAGCGTGAGESAG
ncbi:STAS domain-containing protein [Streptomyces sp. NPDC015350]|uniref:STAS domain-containing protein n=1 Tax=Streptomyces sp. NPDC015350 TaxID=3364955 RepID=UPI0036F90533